MALSNYRLRAAVLAAPLAVGLALAGATAAHATTTDNDPRATEHVYDDNAKTCQDAGLAGEWIAEVDGEGDPEDDTSNFVISPDDNEGGKLEEDQYLSILGVEPGVTVTGIVVKGGNGYNVYVPGQNELSEDPPWLKLHAPLTGGEDGRNIPEISHWYACGTAEDVVEPPSSTPTTPATPTETTTTQPSETSTSPVETTESSTPASSPSSTAGATTTTTEAPIANASDEGDLATTGFGGSWLVWAGALFVLIGVASFAGMRVLKRN